MLLLFSVLGGKDSHQLCPSSKSFELSHESIITIKKHDKLVTFTTLSPSVLLNLLIPWWCCRSGKARNKVFLFFNLSICCLRTTSNVLTNNVVNTFPRGRGRVNYTIVLIQQTKLQVITLYQRRKLFFYHTVSLWLYSRELCTILNCFKFIHNLFIFN